MKKIRKNLLILLFVVGIVLTSGCIKMTINEEISSTGQSEVRMKIDMSSVYGMAGSMSNGSQSANMCKELNISDYEMQNIECQEIEKGVVEVTGQKQREEPVFVHEEGLFMERYSFHPQEASNSMENNQSSSQFSSDMTEGQIEQAKASGVEMTYKVDMPGSLTEVSNGEKKEGKAVFDLLETANKNNSEVYAKSQQMTNIAYIAIAAAIAIVVIVVLSLKG